MLQRNNNSFKGQNIYIGIDVHLKSWSVSILVEPYLKRQFVQKPSSEALRSYLDREFPEGTYNAVYESGFTGFSTYYKLQEVGINCIVVNAADVPTTNRDSVMKSDRIDADKLAVALKSGMIKGIYVHEKENLDDRSVLRLRLKLQKQISGYKIRARHLLYSNGVELPERFSKSRYWSNALTCWMEGVELLSSTNQSMFYLLNQVKTLRVNLLEINRYILKLSKSDRYRTLFDRVYSLAGIGTFTAMQLICEVGDCRRFSNERQFASYLGLIPKCHNSGEKTRNGEKTFRGNKYLGTLIIEASWKAIIKDSELCAYYLSQKKSLTPQKAIIKVARKMSNKILHVMKNEN
jgi:transposase